MNSLIGAEYGQRYRRPIGGGGGDALAELKRLLSSRSAAGARKATGFVAEVIQRCPENSPERDRITDYLLDGDIIVFLCDAMASLDWELLRGILECFKLLSGSKKFVAEEHSAYAVSCVLRTIAHYVRSNTHDAAVQCCLHFISQIFISVRYHKVTSVLSSNTIYNTEQLLEMLSALADYTGSRNNTSLATGLVLHSIVNYQPEDLRVDVKYAEGLAGALEKWLPLLCGIMVDLGTIIDTENNTEIFYGIVCHLGIDTLRLCRFIKNQKRLANFVQKIITNEDDIVKLKQQAKRMAKSVYLSALELVSYTKDNWEKINNNDYGLFLQFLKLFLTDPMNMAILPDFCEMLVSGGYLSILPRNRLMRNISKIHTLSMSSLGEILTALSRQYLGADSVPMQPGQYTIYINTLQRELADVPHDVAAWPRSLSAQLCKIKPYSLLTYLYFYCLTSHSPHVASAPLLPFLVEHINGLPESFEPPAHIVKCLWLVFAMSRISNPDWLPLRERVPLERATWRLVKMVSLRPAAYYTHHPCILLCSFVSQRITKTVKTFTLSLWLERENRLPKELATDPIVLSLLMEIMQTSTDKDVILNTTAVLKYCMLEVSDESLKDEMGALVWTSLPEALTSILQNYDCEQGLNLKCLVELATEVVPENIDQLMNQKMAVLLTLVFSKIYEQYGISDRVTELYYYCLKLAYNILDIANNQQDNSTLMVFVTRIIFLQSVLAVANSSEEDLSCMAVQLLSYIVSVFGSSGCGCPRVLELSPTAVAVILHKEMKTSKGQAFMHLLYTILRNANNDKPIPINLETEPSNNTSSEAFRTLLFRVQMICCKESREKSATGWKTLNAMMKYIIDYKRDSRIITMFATQPWMFTLIRFQLSQGIGPDFLIFVRSWLACLKIILQDDTQMVSYKAVNMQQSLFFKTLMFIKKSLTRENTDCSQKLPIFDEILDIVSNFITSD